MTVQLIVDMKGYGLVRVFFPIHCQSPLIYYNPNKGAIMEKLSFMSTERISKQLADDLVQMHKDTAIELETWETARMFVEKYYKVDTSVKIVRELSLDEQMKIKGRGW